MTRSAPFNSGSSVAGAYGYGMTASGATYGTGFGSQQSLMLECERLLDADPGPAGC